MLIDLRKVRYGKVWAEHFPEPRTFRNSANEVLEKNINSISELEQTVSGFSKQLLESENRIRKFEDNNISNDKLLFHLLC